MARFASTLEGPGSALHRFALQRARDDIEAARLTPPQRVHKGAVNAAGVEPGLAPPPIPNQTSTQCRDGLLAVDRPASRILDEPWRWGGRFMPPTINLFYADLEEDIRRRVGRSALRRAQDGIPAPPIEEVVEIRDAPINRVPE